MTTILDHLDLVLTRPLKVMDGKPKVSKEKSVQVRLELNVDGELFPTTQYYWIPRFLIRKDNNYLHGGWDYGEKVLRDVRKKIIDGEKGSYRIIPYSETQEFVRETDKWVLCRCVDGEGIEYEIGCPKSLIVDGVIPSWFVEKVKDEVDEKGNLRIVRITEESDGKPKTKNGNILDYTQEYADKDDKEFFNNDEDLTDEELDQLLAEME